MESFTYFPKTGEIFRGAYDDIEQVNAGEYLATVQRKFPEIDRTDLKSYAASINMPSKFEFTDVGNDVAQTKLALKRRAELKRNIKKGFSAAVARDLDILERSGALNDSAIQQVTIVQFVQQIIGRLANVSVIAKAFINVPANNLRGKIPEGTWPNVQMQVDRLQEPEITHADFGQKEFRIKRNDIHLYISREDRMEATIDPFAFAQTEGQKNLMQARDLLALKALSGLNTNSSYGTIPDISLSTNNVVPRAKEDSVGAFLNVFTQHFTKYRNYLKYFVWNVLDYRLHQTNYYVRNNIKVAPAQGFGVVPFLGLEEQGCMAIVSPWVPRGYVYALCDEGAYELDGPKIVDSEYDARKFADYTPTRDFIGYMISNPSRFGEKLSLTLAGITKGTEITTDTQIENLLKRPDVEKNDDA